MKNQNVAYILLFVLTLTLFSSVENSSSLEDSTLPEGREAPEINYTATSTDEIFNETSFPRYHIAAKPFGMIQYPNKVNPAIKLFEEQIMIEVAGSSVISDWNFTLIEGNVSFSLDIIESQYTEGMWVLSTLPEIQRAGLYDLQLNCSEGDDYQTHAIQILEEKNYPFKFVHLSDLHLPVYSTDINTSDIAINEIDDIRATDPDFIVVTGDLIQGPTLIIVDPETGKGMRAEVQLKFAIWYLDLLNLPVFYIHGNHEFSQSSLVPDNLEEQWYRYFGPIRYQNFTYLDWTFVGFGSSFEGLEQSEFDEVSEILAQNSNGSTVLYYHYDFADQATSLIRKFPIELALYGHVHSEDLYMKKNTLYHQQAPLFYGAFSSFSIFNETSLNVHSQNFTFILEPYIPPTPEPTPTPTPTIMTTETMGYTYFLSIIGLLVYYFKKRK
jgi:hypothetical protein